MSPPFSLPCDLSLNVAVSADARHVPASCLLLYDRELFAETTVSRIAEHVRILLCSAIQAPASPLRSLAMIGEEERTQLHSWAEDARPFPFPELPQPSVHALSPVVVMFDAQVERSPEAMALECGDDLLTYAQLRIISLRLAHQLHDLGVRPFMDNVGICCGRSTAAYVCVLAVLRAGGAYVPLDPTYPADRLRIMIADSAPAVLLLLSKYEEHLQAKQLQADRIRLLRVDDLIGSQEEQLPPPQLRLGGSQMNLDAPAYVIFTSGSTGRPKGVVQTQRCLTNLVLWQHASGGLREPCRTLQFAPLSFDVHFQELFSAWTNGGTLIAIDETLRRDPPKLLEFISEKKIERLFAPFIALQHIAENFVAEDHLSLYLKQAMHPTCALSPEGCTNQAASHFRCVAHANGHFADTCAQVITAGEQLQLTPSLTKLCAAAVGCELHNHYGPSETHVCTWYALRGDPSGEILIVK